MKLTIHTATYNRAYILPQAYESLKAQTCKDFEWIITDDGSTDGTDELIRSWQMEDNGFPMTGWSPMQWRRYWGGLPRSSLIRALLVWGLPAASLTAVS